MNFKIAVIGLGYVGLPLARLFATKYPVVGFDIDEERVHEIQRGFDHKNEVSCDGLKSVLVDNNPFFYSEKGLFCTADRQQIAEAKIFIITVPTPVDKDNKPVLTPLIKASENVAEFLKKGDTVIYESTVYPGVTEEICVPALEKVSGLKFNKDFFCGYSPERINPGDKERSVDRIIKLTSGSTPETAKKIDRLYASVISAGTYLTSSIKVAEAAKVIENAQRDINIAFVNELAKIFSLMDLDTQEVLDAAGSKWNFLPFKPGLVGGHCIGVDPFYLAEKAEKVGYKSELILNARQLNDSMGVFVAGEVVKLLVAKDIPIKKADVLILGFTFKENCNDIRNTKVIDIFHHLEDYGMNVKVFDPHLISREFSANYSIQVETDPLKLNGLKFDAIVLAVAHKEFFQIDLEPFRKENSVIYDVKGVLKNADKRL